MSDDEVDEELLALLRDHLGLNGRSSIVSSETKVLRDAEYICDNAIDVAIDSSGTKAAASMIWAAMQEQGYSSTDVWSNHELHPKSKDEATVNFIFTMDILNFCFWPDGFSEQAYTVKYRGTSWTGYWSLVAALQRAIDEGIPITSPDFWQDENECTDDLLRHVFRSDTEVDIPLLEERISCLRTAGNVMYNNFDCRFLNCIDEAKFSATALVNLLANNFSCFGDVARFDGRAVRFYKRAQILVGDLWACFGGEGYGRFDDIDKITMFADYRIPQMLHSLGCIQYSPSLDYHIKQLKLIDPGHPWEVQLRGCSIWCIELIRREILRHDPGARVNAILIDFFLYDTVKEKETSGIEIMPHHRTRSIWY